MGLCRRSAKNELADPTSKLKTRKLNKKFT
jgi:hypothetical protein